MIMALLRPIRGGANSINFDGLGHALRQAQDRLLTGQGAPELQSSGSSPSAPAAIKESSHRHPYSAICVPGDSIVTDRITVIAAMRTCGPQLVGSHPAALDGSLPALTLSEGERVLRLT
jgi:hypothetical protein